MHILAQVLVGAPRLGLSRKTPSGRVEISAVGPVVGVTLALTACIGGAGHSRRAECNAPCCTTSFVGLHLCMRLWLRKSAEESRRSTRGHAPPSRAQLTGTPHCSPSAPPARPSTSFAIRLHSRGLLRAAHGLLHPLPRVASTRRPARRTWRRSGGGSWGWGGGGDAGGCGNGCGGGGGRGSGACGGGGGVKGGRAGGSARRCALTRLFDHSYHLLPNPPPPALLVCTHFACNSPVNVTSLVCGKWFFSRYAAPDCPFPASRCPLLRQAVRRMRDPREPRTTADIIWTRHPLAALWVTQPRARDRRQRGLGAPPRGGAGWMGRSGLGC